MFYDVMQRTASDLPRLRHSKDLTDPSEARDAPTHIGHHSTRCSGALQRSVLAHVKSNNMINLWLVVS